MRKVDIFLVIYVGIIISLGGYLISRIPGFIFKIFIFLAWSTLAFFVSTISTCYYMRYFVGRIIGKHPLVCSVSEKASRGYEGEDMIHRYHRYFFWGTVGFGSLMFFIGSFYGIFFWNTFWPLFVFSMLWISSCHHFRYFVNKVVPNFIIRAAIKKLNTFHGYFVWGTLVLLTLHFINVYYYFNRDVLTAIVLATVAGFVYLGGRRIFL